MLGREIWPALAVIGGVDNGIRKGTRVIHKPTSNKGTVLGAVKSNVDGVKVQWDAQGTISKFLNHLSLEYNYSFYDLINI